MSPPNSTPNSIGDGGIETKKSTTESVSSVIQPKLLHLKNTITNNQFSDSNIVEPHTYKDGAFHSLISGEPAKTHHVANKTKIHTTEEYIHVDSKTSSDVPPMEKTAEERESLQILKQLDDDNSDVPPMEKTEEERERESSQILKQLDDNNIENTTNTY